MSSDLHAAAKRIAAEYHHHGERYDELVSTIVAIAESHAAGLRGALEQVVAISADRARFVAEGPRAFMRAEQVAKAALSPGAGSSLLARMAKLEKVANEVRALMPRLIAWQLPVAKLHDALAALDPGPRQ